MNRMSVRARRAVAQPSIPQPRSSKQQSPSVGIKVLCEVIYEQALFPILQSLLCGDRKFHNYFSRKLFFAKIIIAVVQKPAREKLSLGC